MTGPETKDSSALKESLYSHCCRKKIVNKSFKANVWSCRLPNFHAGWLYIIIWCSVWTLERGHLSSLGYDYSEQYLGGEDRRFGVQGNSCLYRGFVHRLACMMPCLAYFFFPCVSLACWTSSFFDSRLAIPFLKVLYWVHHKDINPLRTYQYLFSLA